MKFEFAKMTLAVLGMGLVMSSTSSFAKTYYKWVDSQGSTHYTTTPPPKSAKKQGKVDTYGWKNTPPPATTEVAQPTHESNPPPIPVAVPNNVPPAPPIELENQQREANEALERGQQVRPAV